MKQVFGSPDGLTDNARARYRRLADITMVDGSPSLECKVTAGWARISLKKGAIEPLDPLVDAMIRWLNRTPSAR